MVGRLIWECEDEQSVAEVSTLGCKIYTKADHVNYYKLLSLNLFFRVPIIV